MLNFKNQVIITDPCSSDGGLTISNLLDGNYSYIFCQDNIEYWGERIVSVKIYNMDYNSELNYDLLGSFYVDSGQCIVSDYAFFQEIKDNDNFYEKCCNLSLKAVEDPEYKIFNEKFTHVNKDNVEEFSKYLREHDYRMPYKYKYIQNCEHMNNKCLVSATGFGDGEYNVYVAKNEDDKIIGIQIIFIEDNIDN